MSEKKKDPKSPGTGSASAGAGGAGEAANKKDDVARDTLHKRLHTLQNVADPSGLKEAVRVLDLCNTDPLMLKIMEERVHGWESDVFEALPEDEREKFREESRKAGKGSDGASSEAPTESSHRSRGTSRSHGTGTDSRATGRSGNRGMMDDGHSRGSSNVTGGSGYPHQHQHQNVDDDVDAQERYEHRSLSEDRDRDAHQFGAADNNNDMNNMNVQGISGAGGAMLNRNDNKGSSSQGQQTPRGSLPNQTPRDFRDGGGGSQHSENSAERRNVRGAGGMDPRRGDKEHQQYRRDERDRRPQHQQQYPHDHERADSQYSADSRGRYSDYNNDRQRGAGGYPRRGDNHPHRDDSYDQGGDIRGGRRGGRYPEDDYYNDNEDRFGGGGGGARGGGGGNVRNKNIKSSPSPSSKSRNKGGALSPDQFEPVDKHLHANARQRLVDFYSMVNPEKVKDVDKILEAYNGEEETLFRQLHLKYVSNLRKRLDPDEKAQEELLLEKAKKMGTNLPPVPPPEVIVQEGLTVDDLLSQGERLMHEAPEPPINRAGSGSPGRGKQQAEIPVITNDSQVVPALEQLHILTESNLSLSQEVAVAEQSVLQSRFRVILGKCLKSFNTAPNHLLVINDMAAGREFQAALSDAVWAFLKEAVLDTPLIHTNSVRVTVSASHVNGTTQVDRNILASALREWSAQYPHTVGERKNGRWSFSTSRTAWWTWPNVPAMREAVPGRSLIYPTVHREPHKATNLNDASFPSLRDLISARTNTSSNSNLSPSRGGGGGGGNNSAAGPSAGEALYDPNRNQAGYWDHFAHQMNVLQSAPELGDAQNF